MMVGVALPDRPPSHAGLMDSPINITKKISRNINVILWTGEHDTAIRKTLAEPRPFDQVVMVGLKQDGSGSGALERPHVQVAMRDMVQDHLTAAIEGSTFCRRP